MLFYPLSNNQIAYSLLQSEALQLCKGLEKSLSDMEELVSITKFFPHADEEVKQISHLVRDTLHQGFLFGFEVNVIFVVFSLYK